MTENRDRLSRRRGRCILFFEIFAICFILFLTYTHKPTVTIQNSQFWIEDGRTFIETPISNAKTIKETLLSSSWIHLFPSVRHMVTQIDENVISHITNAKQTTITLKGGNKFVVGNKLTAKIVAKDQLGRQKNYGGDFFIVTLRRRGYQNDVITCDVFDEMMGIYHVSCLLPWPGIAYLNAVLVHPSESIFQMIKKYSSEHEWGVLMNTTMRNSKDIDEYTPCSVGFPEKSPSELCDYSNPSHGEKWTCIKPESGECSSITWQEKKTLEQIQFFDKTYFKRGLNLYAKITGSGTNISIAESSEKFKYLDENLYKTNENPFKSTGWFDNGRWISTVVPGEVSYSVERLQQCTTNKNFYFIGDSTIRQWHEHFAKTLGIKQYGPDNSVAWSQHRDGSSESMNTSLHYRSHGSPLHNPGPVSSRPYISDSLDSITNA
ncbi:NXPE family member 3-like [Styela clava]